VIGSSSSWGVRKPAAAFFERMVDEAACEPNRLAYVGDRVDNDVVPALAAGLVAFHLRRGPWGRLQTTPPEAIVLDSLAELPHALASLG
jgi:FMN phosphatase YigB (HAD superfamily)